MKNLWPFVLSPACPAAWLLFGMLFALAMAHFMTTPWSQSATVAVYAAGLTWVSALTWRERQHIRSVTALDVLFGGFVLAVSVSLIFQGGASLGEAVKFARYLPFLVVIPYLCGRMMRVSDIALFMRITLIAGMAVLPLLLIDRSTSLGRETGRWAFFGLDHGALLIGGLLATALIVLCVRALVCKNTVVKDNQAQFVHYGLIGLIVVFLVWVSARGWLLAGLAGVVVTCWAASSRSYLAKGGLLVFVFGVAALSIWIMPRIDPMGARIYSIPLEFPIYVDADHELGRPILGEASCQPFREGVNSVAMRSVLYQEALAMLAKAPVLGIGAARFGEHSCVGKNGFPHSSVLQSFAELGVIGGGLLAGIMAFSAITLARRARSNMGHPNQAPYLFVLSLLATFLVADQIYGNYFMSVGMWLTLGIVASMDTKDKYGKNESV